METIWAPWRIKYILGKKSGSCIFCYKISKDYKRKNLILYEGSHCLVIMNKYPYAPGHLMVIPKRHLKELGELTRDETVDLFDLVKLGISAVQKALNPHGFNIGANLGKVAGAGEDGHLHFHIVARWNGDANFMPIIGKTNVISEHLEKTYERLLPYFPKKPGSK